jgi:hypothetical protein
MDRRVIAHKLERLRRCVQRIEHKRPPTLAALAADVICHHKLDDFRAFAQAIVHILSRENRPC